MKNNYLIISYYTDIYETTAKSYLIPSVNKFNLKYHIEKIASLGSWRANTYFKPHFILDCLEKFTEDVIFIDVDAIINTYPILFDNIPYGYDLGAHYMDWKIQYGTKDKIELLSGTLYLRNNDKIKLLIHEWIDSLKQTGSWEQKGLELALKKMTNIKVFKLPREYCYISTTPKGKPFKTLKNPIITHYQMSRKLKKQF